MIRAQMENRFEFKYIYIYRKVESICWRDREIRIYVYTLRHVKTNKTVAQSYNRVSHCGNGDRYLSPLSPNQPYSSLYTILITR